jgi:hypothetical protein
LRRPELRVKLDAVPDAHGDSVDRLQARAQTADSLVYRKRTAIIRFRKY